MSELVRFVLEDGASILVEVEEEHYGVDRAGRVKDAIAEANTKFETALANIRPAAQTMFDSVKALSPNSIEIQFGVKLTGVTDAVIAKSTAECNFEVTLTWRERDP